MNCGPICKTEEELYKHLKLENVSFYEDFYNQFCSLHDGTSTDKVVDLLVNRNKESFKNKVDKSLRKAYKKALS